MAADIIVPVMAILATFGTLFGIVYISVTARNRERMALIERGLTANIFRTDNRVESLKDGFLALGLGLGLLFGKLIDNTFEPQVENTAFIFALMLICGGLALLAFYRYSKQNGPFIHESDRSDNKEGI